MAIRNPAFNRAVASPTIGDAGNTVWFVQITLPECRSFVGARPAPCFHRTENRFKLFGNKRSIKGIPIMTTDTPFKQTHAKQTGHAKQTLSPAGFARCGLAAALAAALMLSTAASASAFGYGQDYRDGERITVHELGGVRQVTVPVRWSGNGYEVYVPSWGWTDCAVSCDYTVKKWHFHFWEDQTERGIGSGALGRFLGLD